MADSVNDVAVAGQTWTDLFAGSGITVGTAVTVYVKGSQGGQLAIKATSPGANLSIGVPLTSTDGARSSYSVPAAASGAWFYCTSPKGTVVSVQA